MPEGSGALTVTPEAAVRLLLLTMVVKDGSFSLYRKRSDGRAAEEPVLVDERPKVPSSVSRDRKWLLFDRTSPDTGADIWVMALDGSTRPRRLSRRPSRTAGRSSHPTDVGSHTWATNRDAVKSTCGRFRAAKARCGFRRTAVTIRAGARRCCKTLGVERVP